MRRGRATFLASLLLLGQVAGLAHLVFVTHVTCPEHGDLVHPHEGQAAPRGASTAWYPLPAASGAEDADHCASALHRGDRLTISRPTAEAAPSAPRPLPCLHEPAAQARPSARFRLAPKTSPPLAA